MTCQHVFLSALSAALVGVSGADAAEYRMTGTDPIGASSFNAKGLWNSNAAPAAGNTYVIDGGFTMRTPSGGGNFTFAGDLLTIADDGAVMWKTPTGLIAIPNCIFRGQFTQGQDESIGVLNGNYFIPADASPSISVSGANSRQYTVNATLSGSGRLSLLVPPDGTKTKAIHLRGANSGFTGPINVTGSGKLFILTEDNLGGNPDVFNPNQLTINGSTLVFGGDPETILDDVNRGICISNITGNAGAKFEVAANRAVTIACAVSGSGPTTKLGLGKLTFATSTTYAGATTISEGTLLFNGESNDTPSITVASGASMGGTGTLGAAVTLGANSGIALAGNEYGTLALNHPAGISLNNAALSFDVRGDEDGPSDCLAISGPLAVAGVNTITLALPPDGLPAGTYTLATYASRSGAGTIVPAMPYANTSLTLGDTALTLEVTGGGTTIMTWKGNASANTWNHSAGNWWPESMPFADGMDVVFDDQGVASAPVTTSGDIAPGNITINTVANTYILDTGVNTLTAGNVFKFGSTALTLRGNHHYDAMTVGQYTGSTFISGGTLTLTDTRLIVDTALTTLPNSGAINQSAASVISGSGGINIGGGANLYGANTYTGATTIGTPVTRVAANIFSPSALGAADTVSLAYGTVNNYTEFNKVILQSGITVTGKTLSTLGGIDANLRAGIWMTAAGDAGWAGDIIINPLGTFQIGSDNAGGTLTLGSADFATTITNAGNSAVSLRGVGVIALRSRLIMPDAGFARDDAGTLQIYSTNNLVKTFDQYQGTVILMVDDPLADGLPYTFGRSNDNQNNRGVLNLNGHRLTLGRLTDLHYNGYNTDAGRVGWQRIICTTPSTLVINGILDSTFDKYNSLLDGPVTLVKRGSGTFTLGQTHNISGDVLITGGTLAVTANGSFGANATNIVVSAGTLSVANSDAFSPNAFLSLAPGATLSVAAGVNATVSKLWLNGELKSAGTYGSSISPASRQYDAFFTGAGTLTVLNGYPQTLFFLK